MPAAGRISRLGLTLVVLMPAAAAQGESAPDAGRPFEPTSASEPLYAISAPSDTNGQRTSVAADDGTPLFVEAWLPKARGGNIPAARTPVVVSFTRDGRPGYLRETSQRIVEALVPRGYAFVQSHVRGTGRSGGCLQLQGPLDVDDASVVVDWLARKASWSNGRIGAFGRSDQAAAALGVAARGDPARVAALDAVVALGPSASLYDLESMDGVKFFLHPEAGTASVWLQASMGTSERAEDAGARASCLHGLLAGAADPDANVTPFYRERDHRTGVQNITAATLMVHGLGDGDVTPLVQAGLFDRIPNSIPHAGIFGWFGNEDPSVHDRSGLHVDWARADYLDMVMAWFDRYLKDEPTNVEDWPVAQVQGNDGQWRAESQWPDVDGRAGQLALDADNALGATQPSGSTSYVEGGVKLAAAPHAPATAAVWETAPLPDRLHLTGQPMLDLWVILDRPDAHLAVALETFGPDGNRLGERRKDAWGRLQDTGATLGFRSAQHLDPLVEGRFWQGAARLTPVLTPVRIPVRLEPTDLVVPAGGRIRITIAGSLTSYSGVEGVILQQTGHDVSVAEDPSAPSGTFTRVTVLHDCEHHSSLRFTMPAPEPDLINVRETDEAAGPLADNRPFTPPVADGGGLATAPVCGSSG